jgi:flagellar protein FliO/FliZ
VDKNPKDALDKFIANVKQAKASDGKAKETLVKKPLVKAVSKPLPAAPSPAIEEAYPVAAAPAVQPEAKAVLTDSADVPEVQKTAPSEAVAAKVAAVQEKTPDFLKFKEPVAPEPPSLLASGWKMFYTLAMVLALMFFIFYVFKKVVLKNSALGGNERLIKVLSSGYLGPKKTVTVVDVAGEVLVLGISDGNISLLTQIHDDERIEKLRGGNALGKILSRIGEPKPAESKPAEIKPAASLGSNKLFNKYIKQFTADAETVSVSSAASVAELIRKNRERIKAAS